MHVFYQRGRQGLWQIFLSRRTNQVEGYVDERTKLKYFNRRTERQTDKRTDRETNRQSERQTDRRTNRETNGQTDRRIDRQTDI